MPPLTPEAFIPLIRYAASRGVSGNETLQILRSYGYQQRTQAFYNLYRQARAAALAVPEIQILNRNAYVPSYLMQPGGEYQKYPYQYTVRYETLHTETGEARTAFYTIGSSDQLTKGQIETRAADISRSALDTTNVILTGVALETATVRANAT